MCHHGVTKAARFFSSKLNHKVNKSTVVSIKRAYLEEKKESGAVGDGHSNATPKEKTKASSFGGGVRYEGANVLEESERGRRGSISKN